MKLLIEIDDKHFEKLGAYLEAQKDLANYQDYQFYSKETNQALQTKLGAAALDFANSIVKTIEDKLNTTL